MDRSYAEFEREIREAYEAVLDYYAYTEEGFRTRDIEYQTDSLTRAAAKASRVRDAKSSLDGIVNLLGPGMKDLNTFLERTSTDARGELKLPELNPEHLAADQKAAYRAVKENYLRLVHIQKLYSRSSFRAEMGNLTLEVRV